ncbi:MAG: TylF/MycF/NovP-related O-methyltransferase [Anaerolineae bacterium]
MMFTIKMFTINKYKTDCQFVLLPNYRRLFRGRIKKDFIEQQEATMQHKLNFGKVLRRPYYTVWRLLEHFAYRGREYTLQVPSGHLVYTPWFARDSEFAGFINKVESAGPLIVSLDRCYMIYQFCKYSLSVEGDMVECGAYSGGTAHLIACIIQSAGISDKYLHLFDTFQGMPAIAVPERDAHAPGDFGDTSLEYVQERLKEYPFVRFHAGLMPNTFSEIAHIEAFSFVHDVDIYPTAFECCKWFWPRLSRGGIMLFDDYGFWSYRRAIRAAVDEFFLSQQVKPIVLPTAQAIVIKP